MGLRVIEDTLESDFDSSEGRVVDVLGKVVLEITDRCILQDDIKLHVAELIAAECLANSANVHASVEVHDWVATRVGATIVVRATGIVDTDPWNGFARSWSDNIFPRRDPNSAFWLLLIVPSLLLFW